jgi:hypothetical protein
MGIVGQLLNIKHCMEEFPKAEDHFMLRACRVIASFLAESEAIDATRMDKREIDRLKTSFGNIRSEIERLLSLPEAKREVNSDLVQYLKLFYSLSDFD